ncbi:MAG: two component, sigma54 specific, transcriptional regulator, Fis family [Bryobacterales bacterium]|nr:two component, sigma54 specific, transcriptional regulator, Fis family [Bryobacterales bacterium]
MAELEPIRILVVDDDAEQRDAVARMVVAKGYIPETAQHGEEALEKLGGASFNAIVTDLFMPLLDGAQLLRTLLERGDLTPAIVLTGFGDISHAVSIVHDLRAFWFLEKPVQTEVLHALLERAVRQESLAREAAMLQRQAGYRGTLVDMVGASKTMQQVFALIQRVAPSAASVLISGESGTGKELAARAIHKLSPRAGGPFVAINCAALPEHLIESELFGHERGAFTGAMARRIGCFEQANRGTLFLDEITEMPIGTQAKLLRVLQDGKIRRLGGTSETYVDVRIVAATNRPPETAIQEKRLREDLYYRLNVFQIALPALRHRKEDLPILVDALINELNAKHDCKVDGLEPEALARLMCHAWPGNVRELRNVLERGVIVAREGALRLQQLPPTLGIPQMNLPAADTQTAPVFKFREGATLDEVERAYIQFTLSLIGNNKRRAAKILGIGERTLHSRVAE